MFGRCFWFFKKTFLFKQLSVATVRPESRDRQTKWINIYDFDIKEGWTGVPPGQNKRKKMPRKTWSRHRQLHTVCQISASVVVFIALAELPTWISVCFSNFVMWHRDPSSQKRTTLNVESETIIKRGQIRNHSYFKEELKLFISLTKSTTSI